METINIFENILDNMVRDGYIEETEASGLKDKYHLYIENIRHTNNQKNINITKPDDVQDIIKNPISQQKPKPESANTVSKPPIQLTKEQIKERNISWILNIGVILILISGLIFATTTWSSIFSIVKVCLLFGVSLFFFIISIFSKHILKINKSSNAFWVVGCLFLPTSLLSIGFFKLLGSYYSIFGDGRYIYGLICSLICLPMFIFSTYKFNSRIFSLLTLSTFSLLFAFAIASLYPPHLVLVLVLFAFNALLLFIKQKAGINGITALFFREMGIFIQFNLLITLVLTMTKFSTDILYSVNLIFFALIVFALSITENRFIYDYLSVLIFSIGICLLGNSINNGSIQLLLIVSIGLVFSSVAFIYKKDEAGKYRRYSVISAIATLLSFIYIAGLSIPFIKGDNAMIYSGIACLVILILNSLYLYLKNNLTFMGFTIPTQIFILIYECIYIFNIWTEFDYKLEYLTAATLLLFISGYVFNKHERLKNFANSSAVCSLLSNVVIFIWCTIQKGTLISLPILTAVFALQILILWLKINYPEIKLFLGYLLPVVTFFALYQIRTSYSLDFIADSTFYFVCAFIVFCLQFATAGRFAKLKQPFFYCGHISLVMALIMELLCNKKIQIQVAEILVLGGIYIYSIYYHREKKWGYVWLNSLLIAFTLLLFRITALINSYSDIDLYKYVLYANGFLLMLSFIFIKKYNFKRNISLYLCLITVVLVIGNIFAANILWYEYCAELIYCALLCLILTKSNLQLLLFIPLSLYIWATNLLMYCILSKYGLLCASIVISGAAVLVIAGMRINKLIAGNKCIDFYSLTALISVLLLQYQFYDMKSMAILIPGTLVSIWFFINRNRIFRNDIRPGNTLFTLSLLSPFYSLLSIINIPEYLTLEIYFLPLVVLSYVCIKWIYKDNKLKLIEYVIPTVCYIIIMSHLIVSDSITEAMIIGGFGFLSLIYGSILKTKSAFFTGGILIILTVTIKSRSFWASLQWWIYLAIIGVALVAIASLNEYQKNKNSEGILQKASNLLEKFKDWN
jgi:hypothetical protein